MANLPIPAPLNEVDYEQIEGAVMETARGRWFLAEYARRNRNVGRLLLLTAVGAFCVMHAPLMPVIVKDVLHGDASTYALLSSAPGVGAFLGALLAGEITSG